MAYAERTRPCVDCQTPVTKRANPKKPWRCTECAVKKMVNGMWEMHNRSGPAWDAWQASIAALGPRSPGIRFVPAETSGEGSPSPPESR